MAFPFVLFGDWTAPRGGAIIKTDLPETRTTQALWPSLSDLLTVYVS